MNTPPDDFEMLDDQMADILRQKSPVERLKIVARMWSSARVILRGAIQTEHPDWDTDRVNREIASRISHGVVTDELRRLAASPPLCALRFEIIRIE